MEIFNDQGKRLGRTSVPLEYGYKINSLQDIYRRNDGIITESLYADEKITFPAVNANDITDNLSIRIASIDGLPPERAAEQKKISIMPRREYNRIHRERLKVAAEDKGLVITSLILPYGGATIGKGAFNRLTGSVTIPYGVTTIGERAFAHNRLTSVIIPDSVTSIGESAFAYNQLTRVIIPDSVTTIGKWAFSDNQLTSVTILYGVTTIGESAFADNQLTSVIIPDSVTSIGESAFAYNRLISITIGANVSLGSISFSEGLYATYTEGFHAAYIEGGQKAGTYIRKLNRRGQLEWVIK